MVSEKKKAYMKTYMKKYYIANKEKHNEYTKKYYATHKKYYATHKKEVLRDEVCQIIKKHKEDLADDPERLSTDFILKLVNKH